MARPVAGQRSTAKSESDEIKKQKGAKLRSILRPVEVTSPTGGEIVAPQVQATRALTSSCTGNALPLNSNRSY